MKHLRRILIYTISALLMYSCVLEERIHFKNDLSGIYEMSFALESIDDGEEEGGFSDDFKYEIDSIAKEINDIPGVKITNQEVSSEGFNLSMNFDNLEALNMINTKSDDQKGTGQFAFENDRLRFKMSTALTTNDEISGDPNENKKMDSDERQWVKHRVIITFDKKLKRLRTNGFKKIDKNTLVYDSEKIGGKENISFSIKYK